MIVWRLFRNVAAVVTAMLWLLTLASAYGGYVDPDVFAYLSVLKLVFPVIVIAMTVVGLMWVLLREWMLGVVSCVVLAVCAPQIGLLCPLNCGGNVGSEENEGFSLLDYNIYYGKDLEHPELDYSRSMSYVINSGADVVCLQEQYALNTSVNDRFTAAQVDSLRKIYPYEVPGNDVDVVLLSKYPAERLPIRDTEHLQYFMYDAYRLDIKGRVVTLLNVHLSSYDLDTDERYVIEDLATPEGVKKGAREMKRSILGKMTHAFKVRAKAADIIRTYADSIEGDMVICGDFNDVAGSWAYRRIAGNDMRDAFQDAGCGPIATYNAHHMYFHIDHILYRGGLRATDFKKGGIKSSDHYPIFTKFAFWNDKSDR